jgi:pyridinium-3,5-bisthiocarboxylic acid mononucleotide nickel chelatase
MNEILYYDCFAGISGDMNLAALIDLGVDTKYLLGELKKLEIDEFEVKYQKDIKRGISGTRVDVIIKEHHHEHPHEHNHHNHNSFKEIRNLIGKTKLSEFVKDKSIAIFQKLAEAEGKIHNQPVDEVHFHEVGAIDSIVDIVGAAICIDYLKPSKIIASRIELGSGMVKCAHGLFPVPAPATSELLRGIPVKSGSVPFEATTPTGAAILSVFVDEFIEKHQFTIKTTGYGIGHKDSEIPNVLRAHLCLSEKSNFKTDKAAIIECNIDDMNPEVYEYLLDKLFREGADDVYITPIIMKKSRPAIMLSVLCGIGLLDKFIEIILRETSSIGLRTYEVTKQMLEREIIEINSSLGKVKVKKSWSGTNIVKFKPEYDDCSRIAKELNLPLIQVITTIQKEIDS